jgi:hypothetical protein
MTMPVNKVNMRKWVAGLRSRKFDQARETLCHISDYGHRSYCCLGVACMLAVDEGVDLVELIDHGDGIPTLQGEFLPMPVMEWLGVDNENPNVAPMKPASVANDDDAWGFHAIADSLEVYYELLELDDA